jgi:hypothetical protein
MGTQTAAVTATAPATQTPVPDPSATSGPSNPAPSATPGGPLSITGHEAWPDPYTGRGPGRIAVKLEGSCDRVTVKIFTAAMVCVGSADSGPRSAGWAEVPLPDFLASQPNGLYYYWVEAARGQATTPPVIGKMAILR